MLALKKPLIFALSAALCLTFSVSGVSARVASECDPADAAVPIDSTVTDAAIGEVLEIKAKSAILMEVQTGEILYEMNSDQALPPASITKIMSLLLICEALDRGDISTEDVITASEQAAGMGGSQIWLEAGEAMTVDDLLKAAVIASANDATVALAEAVAGSEEGFVAMMNARAGDLGLSGTHFVNCTGLDAEGHLTTAHDVAVMSCELIKHDIIKNYSTVWTDSLRGGESELVNTNRLVRFYSGATGLKTGTTSSAGYCLSATAERGGMELAAVVMSAETTADRFAGAKKLLDYGFANYRFEKIVPELKAGLSAKVSHGTEKSVPVRLEGGLNLLTKKSDSGEIGQQVILKENLTAPIMHGESVGEVEVSFGGTVVGRLELVAGAAVERLSLPIVLSWLLSGLFKP